MAVEYKDKKAAELVELLKAHKGERQVVILQDYPDPDAISSAMAYRLIAKEFDIEVDVFYAERISHQENLALINLLNIDISRLESDALPDKRYKHAVFLDTQGTNSSLTSLVEAAQIPVLAIIDHHAMQDRLTPIFSDIRPVGATASLFTNYIRDGMVTLRKGVQEHVRLATALMHGILSDTGTMIHGQQFDYFCAAYLQPFFDPDLLGEIMQQQRSHRVMEVIRISLANRIIREGICISGVGFLRSEDRDAIPQAADFLLTEENIHTVIVYGVVAQNDGDEFVQGSLRTIKLTMAPDQFLKEALGQGMNGQYYGGGKATAGGFVIPLGFLSGSDDPDLSKLKWEAFNTKIRRKLFGKIGVETN